MYYVYCLVSQKNSKFHYYGHTSNLAQRLSYHQKGKVRTTKRYLPVQLLGYKEFPDKESALAFEKALKTKASYRKRFLRDLEGSPA